MELGGFEVSLHYQIGLKAKLITSSKSSINGNPEG